MKRPLGVTIIAWLAIVGGALQILGSLGMVGIGSIGILVGSTAALEKIVLVGVSGTLWTGAVLMAFGAVSLLFGIAALAMRRWSWTMGIVLYALNLVAGLVLLFYTGLGLTTALVTLTSAIILGYLIAPTAREALGHEAGGGMTPHAPHPA
jgi:hypothetical protein